MEGPLVASVNVGSPRRVRVGSRVVRTSIWKSPVRGRVAVRGVNLAGDDQADRTVHGGPDKAVYAYAEEDAAWWAERLGRELGEAPFGENLTTRGIDVNAALLGERWRIGTALLEVRQSRQPCFKLGLRQNDAHLVKAFARADRPGAYLAIVEEGELGAGDRIEVVHRPDHDVTVGLMHAALLQDRALLPALLEAPELMPRWRAWAEERVAAGR